MEFTFTPEEAQPAAVAAAKMLSKEGFSLDVEKPLTGDAPYRTTLVAKRAGFSQLIEAQGKFEYHREIQDLARWLAARRIHCELYIATLDQSNVEMATLMAMRRDGVGLLLLGASGKIVVAHRAINPALAINPDPTLKYGDCKQEVLDAVQKFNEVDRKDGLRDLCEIAERETLRVALQAARTGLITVSEANVEVMKWEHQINTLASKNNYAPGKQPVFTPQFSTDLNSFRDARNLVDHKVKSKADEGKRQKLYADKMMQGPRLIAELVSIRRKIK